MAEVTESWRKTLAVTVLITFICALLVTSAALLLKPRQLAWLAVEQNRAIVVAAGLADEAGDLSAAEVVGLMGSLSARLVALNTAEVVSDTEALSYDFFSALETGAEAYRIPSGLDNAGLVERPLLAPVYVRQGDAGIERVVLPFYGPGMWSTISGYLALDADLNTIRSLVIYKHGETPGIGDLVEQPSWRALWVGVRLRDDSGSFRFGQQPGFEVDAISGATVTSSSVVSIATYWLGDDGYGPYLARLREEAR